MNHILPEPTRQEILAAYAKECQAEHDAKMRHKSRVFQDYAEFAKNNAPWFKLGIPVWDSLMTSTGGKLLTGIGRFKIVKLTPEERRKKHSLEVRAWQKKNPEKVLKYKREYDRRAYHLRKELALSQANSGLS